MKRQGQVLPHVPPDAPRLVDTRVDRCGKPLRGWEWMRGEPDRGKQLTDERPNVLAHGTGPPAGAPASEMMSRFHAAHPTRGGGLDLPPAPAADVLLAVAGQNARHGAEHLQEQAAELAQHLDARHRELAHWESTLNARSAAHDDQLRSARLWWQERQQELADRDMALNERQQSLQRHTTEFEQQRAEWADQRQALMQSLERQRQELQSHLAAAETRQEQLQREELQRRELARQQHFCRALRAELEQYRILLQEREASLIEQQRAWETRQESQRQRTRQQRAAIAQHSRFRSQTLQAQQRLLHQRREELDQRDRTLEQTRRELQGAQRDLLELRLTIELARSQLADDIPAAALAAIERCLRDFLAQESATLEAAHQRQRQELQVAAASLAQQQEALAARQETLRQWMRQRSQELKSRVAQLDQREHEIEQLAQQLLRDKQAWLDVLDNDFFETTKKASHLEGGTPFVSI